MVVARVVLMLSLSFLMLAFAWYLLGGDLDDRLNLPEALAQPSADLYPGPPIAYLQIDNEAAGGGSALVIDVDGWVWERTSIRQGGTGAQWERREQIFESGQPIPSTFESMSSLRGRFGRDK